MTDLPLAMSAPEPESAACPSLVLMGVAGCGKTTLGELLAHELGAVFVEGDTFHPAANIAKMAAGQPLTDEDRAGWLEALAGRLREARIGHEPVVLACSALKRRYREVLRSGDPGLKLVFLKGERGLIAERLGGRTGHFMPASLQDSQFRDLEEPAADEDCLTCDPARPPQDNVRRVADWLTGGSYNEPRSGN